MYRKHICVQDIIKFLAVIERNRKKLIPNNKKGTDNYCTEIIVKFNKCWYWRLPTVLQ